MCRDSSDHGVDPVNLVDICGVDPVSSTAITTVVCILYICGDELICLFNLIELRPSADYLLFLLRKAVVCVCVSVQHGSQHDYE